jgi:hypothetical protein
VINRISDGRHKAVTNLMLVVTVRPFISSEVQVVKGKLNVKSLSSARHHAIKTYGGVEV